VSAAKQRAGYRVVDLRATDPQAPQPAALSELAAGAVIRRASVSAPALVVHHQLPSATATYREALQQRGALAHRTARLVRPRARVTADPFAVGLERGLIDEAGVVIPDQHLPFCLRQATHPLTRVPALVDVALPAGLAERVCAGIHRALEHAMHLVIGRDSPLDLAVSEAAHRELHCLAAHPQPHLADRPKLGEAIEDRLDRAAHRFVCVEQDLAPSSPQISPTGSALRSSPRAALLRIPPSSLARSTCSSASLIVPFSPNKSLSLNEPG
jgi:hypothetical protein